MTVELTQIGSGRNKGVGGGPKRTLDEMAEEFGVKKYTLVARLRDHGGPKPVIRQNAQLVRHTTWYDPKAMRAWWNSLPEDVRKGAKP